MSPDQFIDKLNSERLYPELNELRQRQEFSWESTFFPQISSITQKVFQRMSEVFENRVNSFELFGLDFVID